MSMFAHIEVLNTEIATKFTVWSQNAFTALLRGIGYQKIKQHILTMFKSSCLETCKTHSETVIKMTKAY